MVTKLPLIRPATFVHIFHVLNYGMVHTNPARCATRYGNRCAAGN